MKEFVEKLIERLEESVSFTNMARMESRVGKKQTIGFGLGVRSAVKTVKNLASEHNNDFCEWRKVNSNEYVCDAHAETHDSRVLDWCVCPYCGKEIKVVERYGK